MTASFEDADLLREFAVESTEHLAGIEHQILAMENAGEDADGTIVNDVFRAVHSIKGAAGFFGLQAIKSLSHSLENVLNLLREKQVEPSGPLTDSMLRAADKLRDLVGDIEGSNDVCVKDLVAELDELAAAAERPQATGGDKASDVIAVETAKSDVPNQPTSKPTASASSMTEKSDSPEAVGPQSSAAPAGNNSSTARDGAVKSSKESNIRVSVELLDQLMNLAGELVLSRNQFLQQINASPVEGLESVAARISQVTSEMQDAIMQTRMQPIGSVFNRFTRVVRDLSQQLGKKCALHIEGHEVEVDKTIIEAIADPLTHLIRNSVDHGVESPDERERNGKPETGQVHLRAAHLSGQVAIEVKDDGAGINVERLKQKALDKGLITPEIANNISDRDAYRLIFHPGFSTAETVSDVSGRGVGMDVVRSNIERLGGVVDIESQPGKGTSLQITLPLTLAIIPSLIVRNGNSRFAIPQVNILELVRVRPDDFKKRLGVIKGNEVLRLRGKLLPLIRLDKLLRQGNAHTTESDAPARECDSRLNILVVESGQQQFGIAVESLQDSEEIVVKPLSSLLKKCTCLSGATILGDGEIALILDISGIAAMSELNPLQEEASHENEGGTSHLDELQTVLLFANAPEDRFAVPMPRIARIERVDTNRIESIGGRKLIQYRGNTLPLIALEECIQADPPNLPSTVFVIVFAFSGREIGLIAPTLEDIHDVDLALDTSTAAESGVAGILPINGHTTRLLDIQELANAAIPLPSRQHEDDWEPARSESEELPFRILFAEDSSFFRKQVSTVLVGAGYEIVAFPDGLKAWEGLHELERPVDLVLTDVEMPHMTGLELCRNIKQSERFAHLPVITLTSRAGDADIEAGMASGVDDYQVKMDQERLLTSIRKFASARDQVAV
ncbi:MAG: chemotaxis protein CheW [Pirellulales bacterium]|nr:chemotaxis protein CheW [Pirellulales bacterium]